MAARQPVRIGIIGDRDERITAHRGIAASLPLLARSLDLDLDARWLATDTIGDATALRGLHGLWCVPGSPYRSMDGAVRAIERTDAHPFFVATLFKPERAALRGAVPPLVREFVLAAAATAAR